MDDQINFERLPNIQHDLIDPYFENFLHLPQAKYIQTELLMGMSQLRACKMRPTFSDVDKFEGWEVERDYQFKLVLSPNRNVLRLEVYDTQLFPLMLEQLLQQGYSISSSGEDVELATLKEKNNAWLGWAHLIMK